jgi:hypothetical protein
MTNHLLTAKATGFSKTFSIMVDILERGLSMINHAFLIMPSTHNRHKTTSNRFGGAFAFAFHDSS